MADDPNIYIIDEKTGKAMIHEASGEKIRLDMWEQDPIDVDIPAAQTDADIEALGLSEFLPDEEEQTIQMEGSRQLEEVLSWRIIAELWRRFPRKFTLIEAHPGGGSYNCLGLVTKGSSPQFAIDVNRDGGSVHIHKAAFGLSDDMTIISNWVSRMLQPKPERFLDEIAKEARLVTPKKLPPSTPATIVYRFIADFLTHSAGRLDKWECRNGYEDTSGYGGGKRENLFKQFPNLRKDDSLRHTMLFLEQYEYNFWFLLKNETPVLCLDTSGMAYRTDGTSYDVGRMYKGKRRIWPLIFEVAGDVLP
jgi:hypothetical protein